MTNATPESNAVWTIPNALTGLRFVLAGVFLWGMIAGYDLWAISALALAGITDFFDGFLARRLGMSSRLGRVLDPVADRVTTAAVIIALTFRDVVPLVMTVIVLARDVTVMSALWAARTRGIRSLPAVTFSGKSATFGLYVFLPLAYIGFEWFQPLWYLALVGLGVAAYLYWYSGVGYVRELFGQMRSSPRTMGDEAEGRRDD